MSGPRVVQSEISYLGACTGKPIFYGRQRELNNLPLQPWAVTVEDVRPLQDHVSLDREGFALVCHTSTVVDFFDPIEVREIYMREMEQLLMDITGASKVAASAGGVLRRSERSPEFGKGGSTTPARFAHCDYNASHGGSRFWIEKMLPPDEAKARLRGRFAIYNLWRALSDPPQDAPLAVCDARTVAPEDVVCSDCVIDPPGAPELRFENSVFRHNPRHRWCYFPDMTADEVLVFKGFDSDPGRASGVPHAAFTDPSCGDDAPPRASIDVRAFAFFD